MDDLISRQDAIEAFAKMIAIMCGGNVTWCKPIAESVISDLPSVQPEVIHCGECRYYKDVTSIHGDCECGEMWQSLFGEITEVEAINVHKDHYCGYAERKYENNK